MRILVVEDDAPLSNFVRKGLEAEHYAVDVAVDGEQARQMALESDYDLVVLDLNLPKLDGIGVLHAIRPKKPSLPVLVLTARSRIEDRVQSLDTGADDCLLKPFSFTELSARVRALLRRGPRVVETVLRVADLELDRVARKVERAGKSVELTSKEFALLEYLMRNAGRRVTRAMIVEHVWNLSFDTSTNIVDVYINYLRSISSIYSELQTADSSLNSAVTALQSAISLGVEGANSTLSQQDRITLAQQVRDVSQQIFSVANLSYNGTYVFAGTADSQPPYVIDDTAPGGVRYQGNDGINQVQIVEGESVAVNLPGSQLFSANGASVFIALNDLATALENPDSTTDDVGNAVTELRGAYDQLTSARAFYGSTVDQLLGTQNFLNSEKVQLSQQQNAIVGMDMNVAATSLTKAEQARNATVQAAASLNSVTLMDYLSSIGH
ncbi:MAG TPA: response regulator [Terriglobales bacterium]|jgi:DNA-binding response OmpR family regulator|nr:response regulator [Terriglobales bacterium]